MYFLEGRSVNQLAYPFPMEMKASMVIGHETQRVSCLRERLSNESPLASSQKLKMDSDMEKAYPGAYRTALPTRENGHRKTYFMARVHRTGSPLPKYYFLFC